MRNATLCFAKEAAHLRHLIVIVLVLGAMLQAETALAAQTCSSISYAADDTANDVVFSLDAEYPCGQFANGDWWVVDEGQGVTIEAMSPAATPVRHGWEPNPTSISEQPYDDRIGGFERASQPELPYTASAGESIVKTVSVSDADTNCRPCLQFAAVLTVVDAEPAADALRPPYFGDAKPSYRVADVDTTRLPRLDASCCDSAPSFEQLVSRYEHVQLDHKTNWRGRHMHPADNMPDYGASIATNAAAAALRFMLDDFDPADATHRQALVNYLQLGVDLFGMVEGGMKWPPNGGHSNGRKLPVTFAGVLLGAPEIQAAAGRDVYSENDQIYFSPVADDGRGIALYGMECSESMYWKRFREGSGNRACRDPYGYIDGGSDEIGGAYQSCCTANPWTYVALAVRLLQAEDVFAYDPLLDYVDRIHDVGVWASPDPCAPYDGNPDNYGVTYGPDGNGGCIEGEGRFDDKHGQAIDGHYSSGFGDQMWQSFRPCTPDCPGQEHLGETGGEDAGGDAGQGDAGDGDAGAGNDVGDGDTGSGGETGDSGTSAGGDTGAGSDAAGPDDGSQAGGAATEGGCGCRQSATGPPRDLALVVLLATMALVTRIRQTSGRV